MLKEVKIGDKTYKVKPYYGARRAAGTTLCDCPTLYQVIGLHCVCRARIYCETHGTRCFGTHD